MAHHKQQPATAADLSHNQECQAPALSWIERSIVRVGHLVSVLFLISVVIAVYEVISRFVFDAPTIWVHELTVFFCGICLAYGGLYCLVRDRHIRIDVVYQLLKPRARYMLDLFVETVQAVFFAALSLASWIMVKKSWFSPSGQLRLENSGSAFQLPTPALLKAIIFGCVVMMFIVSIIRLVRLVRRQRAIAGEV